MPRLEPDDPLHAELDAHPADADRYYIQVDGGDQTSPVFGWYLVSHLNVLGPILAALRSLFIPASASAPASLDLHEDTDNGSSRVRITAPAALGGDRTITAPDASGTLALEMTAGTTFDPSACDFSVSSSYQPLTISAAEQFTLSGASHVNGAQILVRATFSASPTLTWDAAFVAESDGTNGSLPTAPADSTVTMRLQYVANFAGAATARVVVSFDDLTADLPAHTHQASDDLLWDSAVDVGGQTIDNVDVGTGWTGLAALVSRAAPVTADDVLVDCVPDIFIDPSHQLTMELSTTATIVGSGRRFTAAQLSTSAPRIKSVDGPGANAAVQATYANQPDLVRRTSGIHRRPAIDFSRSTSVALTNALGAGVNSNTACYAITYIVGATTTNWPMCVGLDTHGFRVRGANGGIYIVQAGTGNASLRSNAFTSIVGDRIDDICSLEPSGGFIRAHGVYRINRGSWVAFDATSVTITGIANASGGSLKYGGRIGSTSEAFAGKIGWAAYKDNAAWTAAQLQLLQYYCDSFGVGEHAEY